jgi:hypothetical protein
LPPTPQQALVVKLKPVTENNREIETCNRKLCIIWKNKANYPLINPVNQIVKQSDQSDGCPPYLEGLTKKS